MKQQSFDQIHWRHRLCHGGDLRKTRLGRKARPLSNKAPLHLVFKINKKACPKGLRHTRVFQIVNQVIQQYSRRFFVKVEQVSIQADHIHLLIRGSKRALLQHFFRVVAGQISQRVTGTFRSPLQGLKFWKSRPFTRVVRGWKAYQIVRDYIQMNEMEGSGQRAYRKERLRGLSDEELRELWA